jgi:hypothetical protein
VSATSPGLGDALTDARLFVLPATDTTELLAVLREAEGPTNLTPTSPGPGTVKHNEDIPLGDDSHNHNYEGPQPPSAPKQQTIEELTQLESTRPPDSGDSDQSKPIPLLQPLDIHPAPVRNQRPLSRRPPSPTTVTGGS